MNPFTLARRVAFVTVVLSTATVIARPDGPVAAAPPTSTIARVWVEPGAGYQFLDQAVAGARRSLDVSMYELSDTTFESLLVARERAGVVVRVLLNSAYEGASQNAVAARVLRAGGVSVTWAPSGQIFHAKYVVVDGETVYVGTGNLVREDYPTTRDVWVADSNGADVAAVSATFDADFAHRTSAPVAAGGLVWSPGSEPALVALIDSATSTLLVENEEMDSRPIEDALSAAARRGVDVRVVMTEDSSWTSALRQLVNAGVHVHLLAANQIYVHAKIICANCTASSGTAFVGSENFSTSSLDYNRELGVITRTHAVVDAVSAAIGGDYTLGRNLG